MPERITKLQRWLDLIAYLVGRRLPVPVEELMERVPAYAEKWSTGEERDRAAVRRMFERDKDELRRFGIPLQTIRYQVNFGLEDVEGYRIDRRDFYLPYLRLVREAAGERAAGTGAAEAQGAAPAGPEPGLEREPRGGSEAGRAAGTPGGGSRPAQAGRRSATRGGVRPGRRSAEVGRSAVGSLELGEEDARTALEALRRIARVPGFPLAREARSAFRKLAFDLDPAAFTGAPILFVERPGAEELAERLRQLSDALLARKRVRFRYHGMYRGEATDRDVAPYGLLFQHGHWYLIGHDNLRDAVRVFRVGRMEEVTVNTRAPATPDYEIPEDFRLDRYAGRKPWELVDEVEPPLRAEVRFRFPASLWAERNRHGTLVRREPQGAAVRAFEVHHVPPFLRWILSLGGDAEILEPPELVREFRALAAETAAVYAEAQDG